MSGFSGVLGVTGVEGNVNLYKAVRFETVISVRICEASVMSKYPGRACTLPFTRGVRRSQEVKLQALMSPFGQPDCGKMGKLPREAACDG